MQYALSVVGPHGAVVGIDRDPLPQPIPGARVLQGDIFATPDAELLGTLAAFDVVLSDMAPNTTGTRATDQARSAALFGEALTRAERLLAPGRRVRRQDLPGPRRRRAPQADGGPVLGCAHGEARGLAGREHRDLPGGQGLRLESRRDSTVTGRTGRPRSRWATSCRPWHGVRAAAPDACATGRVAAPRDAGAAAPTTRARRRRTAAARRGDLRRRRGARASARGGLGTRCRRRSGASAARQPASPPSRRAGAVGSARALRYPGPRGAGGRPRGGAGAGRPAARLPHIRRAARPDRSTAIVHMIPHENAVKPDPDERPRPWRRRGHRSLADNGAAASKCAADAAS